MSHGRLFAPVYHGKIVRKKPMASRQVIENTCERCTRTWYTDASKPEPKVELKLSFATVTVHYECLCDGCAKTVSALVEQIAKVMKKNAPVRGAKKKVEEEAKAPSTTSSTTVLPVAPDSGAEVAHAPAGPKAAHVQASPQGAAASATRHPTR
jgi:hypothetical protein